MQNFIKQIHNKPGLVLFYLLLWFIASVLSISGIAKIIEPTSFNIMLKEIFQFNNDAIKIALLAMPVSEIAISIMLFLNLNINFSLAAALTLFTLFLLVAVYTIIAGIKIECGCFGSLLQSETGWGMFARNAVLFLCVLILFIKNKKRIARA